MRLSAVVRLLVTVRLLVDVRFLVTAAASVRQRMAQSGASVVAQQRQRRHDEGEHDGAATAITVAARWQWTGQCSNSRRGGAILALRRWGRHTCNNGGKLGDGNNDEGGIQFRFM